jgi:hypothetical protein
VAGREDVLIFVRGGVEVDILGWGSGVVRRCVCFGRSYVLVQRP